jgi:hypothetical protein
MKLSAWFFNKAIRGQIWVNEIRKARISRCMARLKVKQTPIKQEDMNCFMQECRALQRTG